MYPLSSCLFFIHFYKWVIFSNMLLCIEIHIFQISSFHKFQLNMLDNKLCIYRTDKITKQKPDCIYITKLVFQQQFLLGNVMFLF